APMAGFPINYGSRAFQRQIAERDHFVVTKIKAAGCPILGRTTTPELGSRPVTEFGLHGATRNPWSLDHTSGGSSGGAAAALEAARQAPDRLRIGVQVDAESEVHPELVGLVREVAGRLESLGHQVEEAGPDTRPFRSAQETIVAAGTASYDIEDLSVLDPLNAWLLDQSRRLTAADHARA